MVYVWRRSEEDRLLVWQDYVAGTDPTNSSDTFTASITMVGGVPQVQRKLVLTDEAAAKRVYRKFGKVKLADARAEIPSGHEADYNFFKVTVEMKWPCARERNGTRRNAVSRFFGCRGWVVSRSCRRRGASRSGVR